MAITQTQAELAANVQRTCDIEGTSALERHPLAPNVYDAVNRGIAALDRLLKQLIPDQRFLSSSTITTADGTETYALASTCNSILSVMLTANGENSWLDAYQMIERGELTTPSTTYSGIPLMYRVQGANMSLLPVPSGIYTITYWFVPDATQLTGTSQTIDTIARLDDYVIWYASREIATKDSKWELIASLESRMAAMVSDILVIARNRDMNGPPHIVDERGYDRYGRRRRYGGRLR